METSMIDVAYTLNKLIPKANYGGSLTDNTKESYDVLRWEDTRSKPSWEEIKNTWILLNIEIKKQNCKEEAKKRIENSDWSVLPDVNISNKSEFESYRSQLRNLILNPVESPVFPEEPQPIWS